MKKGIFIEVNDVRAEIVADHHLDSAPTGIEVKLSEGSMVSTDWQKLKAEIDSAVERVARG